MIRAIIAALLLLVSAPTHARETSILGNLGKKGLPAYTLVSPNYQMAQTLLTPNLSSGPQSVAGVIIPAANDVSANWQKAGLAVIGGIPNITTQCGSTVNPSGLTPPTTGDDKSLIQAALDACTSAKFVNLGSGTFNLDQSQNLFINKSIVLRGQGPSVTNIVVRNGPLPVYINSPFQSPFGCGVSTASKNTCAANNYTIYMAPNGTFDWGYDSCGHGLPCNSGLALTADAAKGDTTVTVVSKTGISVGDWVLISESSGAKWLNDPLTSTGQTWASADFLNSSDTPVTNKIVWAKHNPVFVLDDFGTTADFPYNNINNISASYGINVDQANGELHKITAISSGSCPCAVTFDSPLTIGFRVYNPGGSLFQGYISSGSGSSSPGSTLTVTSVTSGTVAINQPLWWSGMAGAGAISYITAGSGTSWTTSNSQLCCSGSGNTSISVGTPGSPATFYGAGFNAQIHKPKTQSGGALTVLEQAGIENLTISRGSQGNIGINFCAYCWVKNVETFGWYNGGITLNASVRNQIDTIYCHDGYDLENNGAEYCLALDSYTTENLITNSIFLNNGKSMVGRATGGGNVISYNSADRTLYQAASIGNWFVDHSLNMSHYKGSHHALFEGNYADTCGDDDTHGAVGYMTYYKNWCSGLRATFNDPSFHDPSSSTFNLTNQVVNDAGNNTVGISFANGQSYPYASGSGPKRAYSQMSWNYWNTDVGNVYGTSGVTTSGNSWVMNGFYYVTQRGQIYLMGWINTGSQSDPNLDGTGASPIWAWQNGNYNYLTSTISWGRTSPLTLPSSLYLGSAPSFFAAGASGFAYPWPWVDSAGGTKIATGCNGACSGLPAKARADANSPFVQP